MTVAQCESDPDPQVSFHRDTDVMATMLVMLPRVVMSSLMFKTCCQLPGGGESLTSTQGTNTVAKQKVQHVERK